VNTLQAIIIIPSLLFYQTSRSLAFASSSTELKKKNQELYWGILEPSIVHYVIQHSQAVLRTAPPLNSGNYSSHSLFPIPNSFFFLCISVHIQKLPHSYPNPPQLHNSTINLTPPNPAPLIPLPIPGRRPPSPEVAQHGPSSASEMRSLILVVARFQHVIGLVIRVFLGLWRMYLLTITRILIITIHVGTLNSSATIIIYTIAANTVERNTLRKSCKYNTDDI
jgi:hypothetical protein